MTKQEKVEQFIETLKGNIPSTRELIEEIFKNGDGGRFADIMIRAFPEARPYVFRNLGDGHHVLVNIDNHFYDITGEVGLEDLRESDDDQISKIANCKDVDTINDILMRVDINYLQNADLYNNYDFDFRGPIL